LGFDLLVEFLPLGRWNEEVHATTVTARRGGTFAPQQRPDDGDRAESTERRRRAHRPQALLLSFFGGSVLDAGLPPIPTIVLLDLLADLGVAEAAARATLKRMTQRGLLARGQIGRTAEYALTPHAENVLRQARGRVVSAAPFDHPGDEWTLLSYSVPENLRALRHRLRAQLTWVGFRCLRDGLWIAPGTVDVSAVLGRSDLADVAELADSFAARALPGTDLDRLVQRAWDVPSVRLAHTWFIDTWSSPSAVTGSLAQLTLLGADWLRLLRADPGLPSTHLGPGWLASTSTEIHRQVLQYVGPSARAALNRSLRAAGRRA
jgi:phenylacetic acid degradation operon negative regulatory protein